MQLSEDGAEEDGEDVAQEVGEDGSVNQVEEPAVDNLFDEMFSPDRSGGTNVATKPVSPVATQPPASAPVLEVAQELPLAIVRRRVSQKSSSSTDGAIVALALTGQGFGTTTQAYKPSITNFLVDFDDFMTLPASQDVY